MKNSLVLYRKSLCLIARAGSMQEKKSAHFYFAKHSYFSTLFTYYFLLLISSFLPSFFLYVLDVGFQDYIGKNWVQVPWQWQWGLQGSLCEGQLWLLHAGHSWFHLSPTHPPQRMAEPTTKERGAENTFKKG